MRDPKKCNTCGATYSSDVSFCLHDGSKLVVTDALLGKVLDGRYRLDRLVGEGGMGEVYRATHIHIDAVVAVKLLRPEFVADQTAIKRFRLEAKAAGRIHHPNAVRVTDFGVTPEQMVYLVMEFAEGQSLRSLMRKEGKLDYLRAAGIVHQVCGAVEAAHHSGVIHRDLKPDNILIESAHGAERVKVLDFGIAKLKETKTDAFLTKAGTIIGTPQYMSPEQCQGKPLDPTSDVYSIGVVLYEMLTGEVPFDGENTLQIVYNQLHELPRPLQEAAPDVPAPIVAVVMRALEKLPERRQSSAAELSEELQRAVESAGETSSLAASEAVTLRRVNSAEARTPTSTPTLNLKQSSSPTSESFSPSADRETTHLSSSSNRETITASRPSVETDAPFSPDKSNLATYYGKSAPTLQISKDAEQVGQGAAGKKTRIGLIATAAAILLAVIGTIIYWSSRSPATSSVTAPSPPALATPEAMVLIPGGKFMMGRNDGGADERPAHQVEIKPFFLDFNEVTNQSYAKFIEATGRRAPKNWKYNGSFMPDEATVPVTYVTWEDATAYAKWADKRLPTEAEWEYAARGGEQGHLYPWGNEWRTGYANIDRKGQAKPAPVRSFNKDVSPFGVFDMAGNVSEWVQDFYTAQYGANPDQRLRVYRGGNFLDAPERSTNTFRWSDFPAEIPDDQILRVGFRCAKDAAAPVRQ